MLLRFPEKENQLSDKSMLCVDQIQFAKHKVETRVSKKTVFLSEHTAIFVLKGKKLLHLPSRTLVVEQGQVVFLKRGIYVMAEYIEEGFTFEALIIFVHEKFLKEFLYSRREIQASGKNSTGITIIPANNLLDSFKIQYLSYFDESIENLKQILNVKLLELFLILISSPGKEKVFDFIRSAVDPGPVDIDFVIRNHLLQPLTVAELANLCGRSLAAFKRDFQLLYNEPPKRWINRQRLMHAHMLLSNSEKNVSQIADECGFESVSHFIRLFKKEYGITPNNQRPGKLINAKFSMIEE